MSRAAWVVLLALGVIACTSGDSGETEIDEDDLLASGSIITDDGSTGHVRVRKAFGMATNGQGAVYLASNELATCPRVVEYLQTHDDPFNPHDILGGGECNMSFAFDYDEEAGYDGDSFTQDDALMGIWSVNCAMDEGDFVLETRKGFRDYYWSGRWWQGDPTLYTATVSGNQDDQNLTFEFEMTEYTGNFIYEEFQEVLGDGAVVSLEPIQVKWCTEMVRTSLFDF